MSELEVVDNFLPDDQFLIIESAFTNIKFPWCFVPQIKGVFGKKLAYGCERDQFVHEFWNPIEGNVSEHYKLMTPFINRLKPAAVLRSKVNLQPRHDEIIEDPLHTDFDNISASTSIFYVNTCNGYTHFEDGTKVDSVANRLITFPTQTKHGGACCTDTVARIVINFNYHKYYINKELKNE